MKRSRRKRGILPLPTLKKVLLGTLALKGILLLLVAWAYTHLPFQVQNWNANFHFPPSDPPGPWGFLKTWDAQYYLFLADQGFRPDHLSSAFYPLYPLLIRVTNFVLPGGSLAAGIFLSTLFTLLGMRFLFLFVKKSFDEDTALWTCLLVLSFPTGFYLGLVYTESLFLLLAAAFFFYWREKKVFPALAAAFFLPLCRPTGILVLVPLLVGLVLSKKDRRRDVGLVLGALGGFLSYLAFMKVTCGGYWAGFEAQDFFRSGILSVLSAGPLEWLIRNFFTMDLSLCDYRTSALDRLALLAFFLTLPWAWKRLPRSLFFYALALGTLSACSLYLVSYMRYLGAIFPFFILLATLLKDRAWVLAALFVALQVYLVIRHVLYFWVG